jgi:hypothetical protein
MMASGGGQQHCLLTHTHTNTPAVQVASRRASGGGGGGGDGASVLDSHTALQYGHGLFMTSEQVVKSILAPLDKLAKLDELYSHVGADLTRWGRQGGDRAARCGAASPAPPRLPRPLAVACRSAGCAPAAGPVRRGPPPCGAAAAALALQVACSWAQPLPCPALPRRPAGLCCSWWTRCTCWTWSRTPTQRT